MIFLEMDKETTIVQARASSFRREVFKVAPVQSEELTIQLEPTDNAD